MAQTFKVTFQGPSGEHALREAPDHIRDHLLAVFTSLEENPFVDNVTKFHYTKYIPVMMNAYNDDVVKIVYQIVSFDPPDFERTEIQIYAISWNAE